MSSSANDVTAPPEVIKEVRDRFLVRLHKGYNFYTERSIRSSCPGILVSSTCSEIKLLIEP